MRDYFKPIKNSRVYFSNRKNVVTHGSIGVKTLEPGYPLGSGYNAFADKDRPTRYLVAITTDGVFSYGEATRGSCDELNHYDLTIHKDVYTAGEVIKYPDNSFEVSNMSGTYCPEDKDSLEMIVSALIHSGEITDPKQLRQATYYTSNNKIFDASDEMRLHIAYFNSKDVFCDDYVKKQKSSTLIKDINEESKEKENISECLIM